MQMRHAKGNGSLAFRHITSLAGACRYLLQGLDLPGEHASIWVVVTCVVTDHAGTGRLWSVPADLGPSHSQADDA